VIDFIHAHQDDASKLQTKYGVQADYFLGLSGWESQWGANGFAQNGNNFFSLHGGSTAPFASGPAMKAGRADECGRKQHRIPKRSSVLASMDS
jgi:uncharacterized FlgJ-related protein